MRVAILGAGPAGCAAAIALRMRGADVWLISDGRHGVGEQLHPANQPLLDLLEIPMGDQLVCLGVNDDDYLRHPLGPGWLLDRDRFGRSLRERAVHCGATLLEPERLVRVRRGESEGGRGSTRSPKDEGAGVRSPPLRQMAGWTVELTQRQLECDFLIDASGRRAFLARRLGVKRQRFELQNAAVGWLQLQAPGEDPDATLCLEAVEDGYCYTCRVRPGRRVATWLTAGRPRADLWWARLQSTRGVRERLRGYQRYGALRLLPADTSMLEQVSGPGWLAIGDAALSLTPLSGQGIFQALESGLGAATLVDAPPSALREYHDHLRERLLRCLRRP